MYITARRTCRCYVRPIVTIIAIVAIVAIGARIAIAKEHAANTHAARNIDDAWCRTRLPIVTIIAIVQHDAANRDATRHVDNGRCRPRHPIIARPPFGDVISVNHHIVVAVYRIQRDTDINVASSPFG